MLLLVLLGVASAAKSQCNVVQALQTACARDSTCKIDSSDFTGLVSWGKNHSWSISISCLQDLKQQYPALYVCSDDVHRACPDFGRLGTSSSMPPRHDNDDDDDDDDGHSRHSIPHPLPFVGDRSTKGSSTKGSTKDSNTKGTSPNPNVKGIPPTKIADAPAAVRTVNATVPPSRVNLTNVNVTALPFNRTIPRRGPAMPPKRLPKLSAGQCLQNSLITFSASCRSAIDMQWKTQQRAKGVWKAPQITGDELAQLLGQPDNTRETNAEPMPAIGYARSFNPATIPAAGLAALLALACICCCCCRRCCKKRHHPARVGTDVPLSALPEAAVVVPVANPVSVPRSSSVPVATAVSVPRATAVPTAMPYNGQGLGTYVPMAQPVAAHV